MLAGCLCDARKNYWRDVIVFRLCWRQSSRCEYCVLVGCFKCSIISSQCKFYGWHWKRVYTSWLYYWLSPPLPRSSSLLLSTMPKASATRIKANSSAFLLVYGMNDCIYAFFIIIYYRVPRTHGTKINPDLSCVSAFQLSIISIIAQLQSNFPSNPKYTANIVHSPISSLLFAVMLSCRICFPTFPL